MGGLISEILAATSVALLNALWARHDGRAAVLRQVERQQAQAAFTAMAWKLAHPVDPGSDPLYPDRLRHDPDGPVPP